jgi:hypothetical protein
MAENAKFKIKGTGNELCFTKDGKPVLEEDIKGLSSSFKYRMEKRRLC